MGKQKLSKRNCTLLLVSSQIEAVFFFVAQPFSISFFKTSAGLQVAATSEMALASRKRGQFLEPERPLEARIEEVWCGNSPHIWGSFVGGEGKIAVGFLLVFFHVFSPFFHGFSPFSSWFWHDFGICFSTNVAP